MPKRADYQIVWSPFHHGYELVHGALRCLLISDAEVQWWFCHVQETMHFCARSGETLTLRLEAKQRVVPQDLVREKQLLYPRKP